MIALQLNPPIRVLTPKGEGFARILLDYGPDLNSVWIVSLFDTGETFHVDSAEIRMGGNAMYDIPEPQPFTERMI
jgi:hypothetical protein